MEHEETKQSPQKTPHTQHEQVNPDLVLAPGLQDQDDTFPTLSSSESEDESESFSGNDYDGDADFFLSQEFETDLQFLESEGSNYEEEEMEEDDDDDDDGIDVDELTYEELIELGDFIGKEKKGLSAKEISSCLHSYTYHAAENKSGNIIDLCVICQVEYEESEALMALQCDHPYHTDCITKWLQIKKVCPICSSEVSVPQKVD